MRKIKVYFLLSLMLISYNAFSQDTIRGFIKSSCIQSVLPITKLPDFQFKRIGDSICLSGMIQANCAGTHLAIVIKSADSIVVTTVDTGFLATCYCIYNFELFVKASITTKFIVFNNVVYNVGSGVDCNESDTICGYLTSNCMTIDGPYPDPQFMQFGDSIWITGKIGANCSGTHLAIIRRSSDSIVVTTLDTGQLATCWCVYNYRLSVKVFPTDSFIVLNQIVYNLRSIINDINEIGIRNDLVDVYYDNSEESIRYSLKSGLKLNSLSIYDIKGCLQLTIANDRSIVDMSGFKSGLYLLDFLTTDNRHIKSKIIKK